MRQGFSGLSLGRRCLRLDSGAGLQQICKPLTATVFQPVPVTNRQNCHERNREKYSCNAGEFLARQYREDYSQRMQMNSLTDQTRIDEVVVDDPEHPEEEQH